MATIWNSRVKESIQHYSVNNLLSHINYDNSVLVSSVATVTTMDVNQRFYFNNL